MGKQEFMANAGKTPTAPADRNNKPSNAIDTEDKQEDSGSCLPKGCTIL